MFRVVVPALRASSSIVHSLFDIMAASSIPSQPCLALTRTRANVTSSYVTVAPTSCRGFGSAQFLQLLEREPGDPPPPGAQRQEIAEGLGVDQGPEGVGLAGDRQVDLLIGVRHLKEDPRVRAPFVELARRMQEPWSEPDGGRYHVGAPHR